MAAVVDRPSDWVSLDHIRDLSKMLAEPEEFRQRRSDAYGRFVKLPIEPDPLYRGYGYFTKVDLGGLDAVSGGPALALPAPRPGVIRVLHDAGGTHPLVPAGLEEAGVRVRPFVGGRWGLPVDDLLPAPAEASDRLSALSIALQNRGYALDLPDRFPTPVHVQDLTVVSQPHEALSVRRVLHVGAETQVLFTEEVYCTPAQRSGQRFHASNTVVDLAPRAKAVYLSMHAPDLETVSVYQRAATLAAGSRLAWLWAGLGGFRTKARNRTRLTGQGSVVDDLQLFYGTGEQSYDSAVFLTHEGTDTHGQSITRGVFTDKARGMSRGLVRIEKDANKTLSFISEHAMLLSRGARSDTIPILEILCRDVKATHSTSVHPVDPEQVFYLESRGIREQDAVRMIGEGFLSYVLDRSPVASLRDVVYPALEARWNGEELPWTPDGSRALPELHVTGTEAAPEWRFDAKLR